MGNCQFRWADGGDDQAFVVGQGDRCLGPLAARTWAIEREGLTADTGAICLSGVEPAARHPWTYSYDSTDPVTGQKTSTQFTLLPDYTTAGNIGYWRAPDVSGGKKCTPVWGGADAGVCLASRPGFRRYRAPLNLGATPALAAAWRPSWIADAVGIPLVSTALPGGRAVPSAVDQAAQVGYFDVPDAKCGPRLEWDPATLAGPVCVEAPLPPLYQATGVASDYTARPVDPAATADQMTNVTLQINGTAYTPLAVDPATRAGTFRVWPTAAQPGCPGRAATSWTTPVRGAACGSRGGQMMAYYKAGPVDPAVTEEQWQYLAENVPLKITGNVVDPATGQPRAQTVLCTSHTTTTDRGGPVGYFFVDGTVDDRCSRPPAANFGALAVPPVWLGPAISARAPDGSRTRTWAVRDPVPAEAFLDAAGAAPPPGLASPLRSPGVDVIPDLGAVCQKYQDPGDAPSPGGAQGASGEVSGEANGSGTALSIGWPDANNGWPDANGGWLGISNSFGAGASDGASYPAGTAWGAPSDEKCDATAVRRAWMATATAPDGSALSDDEFMAFCGAAPAAIPGYSSVPAYACYPGVNQGWFMVADRACGTVLAWGPPVDDGCLPSAPGKRQWHAVPAAPTSQDDIKGGLSGKPVTIGGKSVLPTRVDATAAVGYFLVDDAACAAPVPLAWGPPADTGCDYAAASPTRVFTARPARVVTDDEFARLAAQAADLPGFGPTLPASTDAAARTGTFRVADSACAKAVLAWGPPTSMGCDRAASELVYRAQPVGRLSDADFLTLVRTVPLVLPGGQSVPSVTSVPGNISVLARSFDAAAQTAEFGVHSDDCSPVPPPPHPPGPTPGPTPGPSPWALPWWAWLLIALVLLAAVAGIVVAVVRARKDDPKDAPAMTPAAAIPAIGA
jgi:hypothetical protein